KSLNEYINKAQNHIEKLKTYGKELNNFFKEYQLPTLDYEDSYGRRSSLDDDDKSNEISKKDLKTFLIATGYFIKEVIDKNSKNDKNNDIQNLNEFWGNHYQFQGGSQKIIFGENWNNKIKSGEEATIKYFNEKPKEIIEEALKLAGNSPKAQNIINFFKKIGKDGLQEETSYDEKTLQSYINDRQQEKPVL
ncbi:MAG: hypothetical protein Q4B84_05390, partial [Clostridia bacterium]|nr:hypothetical protein [Clostridia bacterium]